MLASLIATNTVTDVAINARMYDLIQLLTGSLTEKSQLNSGVWDLASSTLSAVMPGNWTVAYSSVSPLSNLAGTSATSWSVVLQKDSVAFGSTKTVQVKLERSAATINLYPGVFSLSTGAATYTTTAYAATSAVAVAGMRMIVGSNASSVIAYMGSNLVGCVERTTLPYDGKTLEPLSVAFYIGSAGTTYAFTSVNYFNGLTYSGASVGVDSVSLYNHSTNPTVVTRDSENNKAIPLLPLIINGLTNGWLCDLSANSGIYRTMNGYGSLMSSTLVGSTPYRILPLGSIRYLLPDV